MQDGKREFGFLFMLIWAVAILVLLVMMYFTEMVREDVPEGWNGAMLVRQEMSDREEQWKI